MLGVDASQALSVIIGTWKHPPLPNMMSLVTHNVTYIKLCLAIVSYYLYDYEKEVSLSKQPK